MNGPLKIWSDSLLAAICCIFLLLYAQGCLTDLPTYPEPPTIKYKFQLPPGKLPWPHQSPDLTKEEYDSLVDSIWIIQNYGENEGGDNSESGPDYLHDGLDIVVGKKGTKIYAVDSGYVRQASGAVVTVSNSSNPFAKESVEWHYVHVENYQVQVGQKVVQGQYLADESFDGLQHVHLMRSVAGNGWNYVQGTADPTACEDFFEYRDVDPPIIDPEFYFFKNNSDERIQRSIDGSLVVSGDVDIVVGIREVGQYAHSHDPTQEQFGDRLAVTGAKYIIAGNGIVPYEVAGLDFRKLNIYQETGTQTASILYKPHWLLSSDPSWNKRFSYYILSNFDGQIKDHFLRNLDPNNCWRTNQKDQSGRPQLPNGMYTVTVTVWDAKGNQATASMQVSVENP